MSWKYFEDVYLIKLQGKLYRFVIEFGNPPKHAWEAIHFGSPIGHNYIIFCDDNIFNEGNTLLPLKIYLLQL